MFKPFAAEFLQHLTSQNNWSRQHLVAYAGNVLEFNIAFIKAKLIILEDGSLGVAPAHADIDASIHIPPSLALRLMAKDEAAKMLIKIEGNTHLASEIGKVLQHMHWDIEEDLSKIIGDIPANKLVSFSKQATSTAREQVVNIAEMLSEYWQEERPIIAKKWQVEKFNTEVDILRRDFTRLNKRIAKLKQQLQESNTN